MEKRYRALRIVGSIYKIVGAIVLILAIIGAVGICAAGVVGGAALRNFSNEFGPWMYGMGPTVGGVLGGIISGLITLIAGGIGGLTLYATGEAIYLLMDIEENTRMAARTAQPNEGTPPA